MRVLAAALVAGLVFSGAAAGTVVKPGESKDGFSLTAEGAILFGGEPISPPTENFFPESVSLQVEAYSPSRRYALALLWDDELQGVEGFLVDLKLKFPVADLLAPLGLTRDIPGRPPMVLKPGIERGIAWSPEETQAAYLTRSGSIVELALVDLATGKVRRVPLDGGLPGVDQEEAFPQLATLKWLDPFVFRIEVEVRCRPGPDPACREKQGSHLKSVPLEVDTRTLAVKLHPEGPLSR